MVKTGSGSEKLALAAQSEHLQTVLLRAGFSALYFETQAFFCLIGVLVTKTLFSMSFLLVQAAALESWNLRTGTDKNLFFRL